MYSLEPFRIDLKVMKEGQTTLTFKLTDDYFEAIEAPEVHRGALIVRLNVTRKARLFELDFHTEGSIYIPCDLCLDDMEQPILTDSKLVARLGDDYSEDDDVIAVDEDEGILDVAWLIYEFIVLNIPIRHVHAPGKCNPDMVKVLAEHSASRRGSEDESTIDPRWAALSKLKE